jgi:hypothetical protein
MTTALTRVPAEPLAVLGAGALMLIVVVLSILPL